MIDYKQNKDNDCDLDFSSGDLEYTESTEQHQRDLILAAQGHIRDMPDRGVGSINYLLDNDKEHYLRAVRIELAKDGQKVRSVGESETGTIYVDAAYENS